MQISKSEYIYLSLSERTKSALENGATTIFQGRFEIGVDKAPGGQIEARFAGAGL